MGDNISGYTPVRRQSTKAPNLTITSGPVLQEFLDAALRGCNGTVEFTAKAARIRGASGSTVRVDNITARCEDGNGMQFNINGTVNGRRVEGYYNANPNSALKYTGHLIYTS